MRMQIIVGIRALLVVTVLTGLLFPLVMTGIAQVTFHDKANGSLVTRDGHVVGSNLIGQSFSGKQYFHSRPSAAAAGASGSMIDEVGPDGQPTGKSSPADPKDLSLTPSGASNLGPSNDDLISAVADRVAAYRTENGLDPNTPVPVDAVTTSASGLDPQISVANARLQAPRVAEERGLALDDVLALVAAHTTGATLGILGDKGVNVLALNLALDDRQAQP